MQINLSKLSLLCLLIGLLVILSPVWAEATAPPALPLANTYHEGVDLSNYYVSEKLDGVRAYWDGKQLLSRRGNVFHAPQWFIEALPKDTTLDGELWTQRKDFEAVSSIARQQTAHEGWRKITYRVFDLPSNDLVFFARQAELNRIVKQLDISHLQTVPHVQIITHQALQKRLQETISKGGEGLILRHKDGLYQNGRSDDMLKLKPFMDAEAVVVAHHTGKGRLSNRVGSLEVERPDGVRFKVGSGLNDKERTQPPPIGTVITYRYNGLTKYGKPRFPVFLRIRKDEPK